MPFLLNALGSIAGLISLVCFILVLIKMFQSGDTGMGVLCIVLFFCIGIGEIIACVLAWQNAGRYGLTRNFLQLFTICLVAAFVLSLGAYALSPKIVWVQG